MASANEQYSVRAWCENRDFQFVPLLCVLFFVFVSLFFVRTESKETVVLFKYDYSQVAFQQELKLVENLDCVLFQPLRLSVWPIALWLAKQEAREERNATKIIRKSGEIRAIESSIVGFVLLFSVCSLFISVVFWMLMTAEVKGNQIEFIYIDCE